jgi:phage terminase small subunit
MSLNPKQLRFVDEYLIDQNGTQAAIRAGYSAKTANEQASRLLANVSIRAAVNEKIKALQEKLKEKAEVTLQDIINELDENRKAALTAETVQAAAATAATMAKAKLLGFVVEKTETKHSGEVASTHKLETSSLTTEQLRALANIRLKA